MMSTTFPNTSSLKIGRMVQKRDLKKRYGGRKKKNKKVIEIGRIMMFRTLLMKSMASLQNGARREKRQERDIWFF